VGINRDKVLSAAQKHTRKGNWDKAIREYERLVDDDPTDVRSKLKIGDLYVKANDFENALVAYQEVAYFYAKDDFYEKAAAVYKQALRIAPETPTLHRDLGEAYFRLGRLKDSVRSFHRAQKLYKAVGNDNEQRVILERMTQIDPQDVGLKVQLAERYEKDGFRADAIKLFREAAEVLYEEGRKDEYLQVGERIVYLEPDEHDVRKDIIRIHIERADDRRALKHLQAAFRKTPKDVQILEMLAKTFARVGNPEKAVLVFQELANAFEAVGQFERQKNAYRQILDIDPENEVARKALADELDNSANLVQRDTGTIDEPKTQDALDGIEFLDDPDDALDGVEFLDEDDDFDKPEPIAASKGNDFLRFAEETVAGVDADLSRLDSNPASSLADKHTEVSDITDQLVELVPDSPTEESVVEVSDDEIGSFLTEIDVFLKYGLFDRAESTITRILELAPENLRAREQMRRFLELTGEREAAAGQLIQMARITKDNPSRASGYLRRALETTDHPDRVQQFAKTLGIPLEPEDDIMELEADFLDEVSEGISEASEVFEPIEEAEPGAHTVDLVPEPVGGLSGESAVEDDEFDAFADVDDIAGALIDEMEAAESTGSAVGEEEFDIDLSDVELVEVDDVAMDVGAVDVIAPVNVDDDLEIADFDDADFDDADFDDFDDIEDIGGVDGDVMDLDVDDVDFDDSELDALQDAIDDADFEFSFTEGEADEMFDELFGGSSLDMDSDLDGTAEEISEGVNPFGARSLSGKFDGELSEMSEYAEGSVMTSNLELGSTYRDMGLWAEALDEFKQALDDPEAQHAASFNVALCEIELGDLEAGAERLRELSNNGAAPGPIRAAANAKLDELSQREIAGA
jgi:tetratricopeptide (TPR) repeat protein